MSVYRWQRLSIYFIFLEFMIRIALALRIFKGRLMQRKPHGSYALLAMVRKNRDGGRKLMLRRYRLLRGELSIVS